MLKLLENSETEKKSRLKTCRNIFPPMNQSEHSLTAIGIYKVQKSSEASSTDLRENIKNLLDLVISQVAHSVQDVRREQFPFVDGESTGQFVDSVQTLSVHSVGKVDQFLQPPIRK